MHPNAKHKTLSLLCRAVGGSFRQYRTVANVYLVGNDIAGSPMAAGSNTACLDLCKNLRMGCAVAVYRPADSQCFLKFRYDSTTQVVSPGNTAYIGELLHVLRVLWLRRPRDHRHWVRTQIQQCASPSTTTIVQLRKLGRIR